MGGRLAVRCTVLLLVIAGVVLPAGPASATFAPGSPEGGDPYFPRLGNSRYQVEHYDIDVRYDPASKVFSAVADISARVTDTLTDEVYFDLNAPGLVIDRVTVDGATASATRDGNDVRVGLLGTRLAGFTLDVRFEYHGVPGGSADAPGWIDTGDGIVVVAEPDGASTWFPSNDHPSDKATFDITLTVPAGVGAVSNGLPGPTTTGADGWQSTTWAQDDLMATYLATVAIGDYEVTRSTTAAGIPIINAVSRAMVDSSEELDQTDRVLAFLTGYLGPYPYDSAGAIVLGANPVGVGALETQTRPIYTNGLFTRADPSYGVSVMLHEYAHQWFGDLKALRSWRDIWLNEGFATYLMWMWEEHEGVETAAQTFNEQACRAGSDSWWSLPVGDPGASRLFDDAVYQRGAMTLHALRVRMGDAAFFALLRQWASGGSANVATADFVAMAEQVSGLDLDSFFAGWLAGGKPSGLTCQPITPPAAPTSVVVVPDRSTASIDISWLPPLDNGGSAISDYVASLSDLNAATTESSPDLWPWARTWRFTGLDPTHRYRVSVAATSSAGTGPAVSREVTLAPVAPSVPGSVTALAGNARATVSWAAPADDGGSAVSRYVVKTYLAGSTSVLRQVTVAATSRTTVLTGLTNGTRYEFTVAARNAVGDGAASVRTAGVTPGTVPGAPTIGSASGGSAGGAITATAAWAAPVSTGGVAIAGYRVYALRMSSSGAVLATTTSAQQASSVRSLSMTLPVAGSYRFQVAAVNGFGEGARSARSGQVAGR